MNNVSFYFINLDRSHARREYMERTLEKIGIVATRIAAVDGSHLSDDECLQLNPHNSDFRPMSKAEIGCFLSHRSAWKKIVDGNTTWGSIFEDDIAFSRNTKPILSELGWLPKKGGIIRLETTMGNPALIEVRKQSVLHSHHMSQIKSLCFGTGAYLVDKTTARRLLAGTDQMIYPVDREILDTAIPKFADINRWQVIPALCIQQKTDSALHFLPEGAELSIIDAAGTSRKLQIGTPGKRRGLQKLKRELVRPFEQVFNLARNRMLEIRHKGRWTNVTFKD